MNLAPATSFDSQITSLPSLPHRVALVTPWYGNRNGGAEVFCAGLAKALIAVGRQVEVLTTCGRDPFQDWGINHWPPGLTEVDGVPVRRFPVKPRSADRYAQLSSALQSAGGLSVDQEEELLQNSINSNALVDYIAQHRSDYIYCFLPYLYGTTYYGAQAAHPANTFLIPCLHNEPFAYLRSMHRMFRRARGCMFLSPPERDFASGLYDLTDVSQCIMGGGLLRVSEGDADAFRRRTGITAQFLLSVGRKVAGKGADLLIRYFADYSALYPQEEDLHLVLIGSGEIAIPEDLKNRIHSLQAHTSEEVYDAMAACEIFIQPSFLESFSIVLMEAWLHKRPVLVNGQCEVTSYHALASNGGMYFPGFPEFAEEIRFLRENPGIAAQLGENGYQYVEQNYLWPDTVNRFQTYFRSLENRPVEVEV